MIEVKGLVKKYGSKTVLDNVSFEVEEGEIMGLLGPNGAGKSTTMNIITGNLSATDGMVKINGYEILESPLEAKKELGFPITAYNRHASCFPEMKVLCLR